MQCLMYNTVEVCASANIGKMADNTMVSLCRPYNFLTKFLWCRNEKSKGNTCVIEANFHGISWTLVITVFTLTQAIFQLTSTNCLDSSL